MPIFSYFSVTLIILIIICIILISITSNNTQRTFNIILSLLILILIIYYIYELYSYIIHLRHTEPVLISGEINARGGLSFSHKDIPKSNIGSEYTYSFWIYPSGWDYKFGKPKHVLSRGTDPKKINSPMYFNPGVWFYPQSSNLMIRFDTYGDDNNYIEHRNKLIKGEEDDSKSHQNLSIEECQNMCSNSDKCKGISFNNYTRECYLKDNDHVYDEETSEYDSFVKTNTMNPYHLGSKCFNPNNDCDLVEIPIQRWSHITISLWNRTTDIYLNGKLVRSCILKNVPKIPEKDPLYVCQDGGFDGKFAQLKYFNRSLNADEIYSLYSRGPISWSLFSTYEDNNAKIKTQHKKDKK